MEIKTPKGWKSFDGIKVSHKKCQYELRTILGKKLKCSSDHKLKTVSGWKEVSKLKQFDFVKTILGWECIGSIKKIDGDFTFYDLVNVSDTMAYYTNDIVSHNCHFLGSMDTLIEGWKLRELAFTHPIEENSDIRMYHRPEENHIYFLSVDVSHGKKMDNHAISVIDITEYPFKIVATYYNDELSYLMLPDIINRLAIIYNRAYVLIELNDLGTSVADSLLYDLEYENMLAGIPRAGSGQVLSEIDMKYKGITVRKQTKRIGCSNLKTLVEGDKLLLNDFNVISEISNFIKEGSSYSADSGHHDDLVMTLVNFSWCTTQEYFKELTNRDIRDIYAERIKQIEENMVPFGFIEDGNEDIDENPNF